MLNCECMEDGRVTLSCECMEDGRVTLSCECMEDGRLRVGLGVVHAMSCDLFCAYIYTISMISL